MSFSCKSLVTDRKQSDLNRAKALAAIGWGDMTAEERAEWDTGLKGAYNAKDLNRVTSACLYLSGLYTVSGYTVTYIPINIQHDDGTIDTVWRESDVPADAQLSCFINNVRDFWAQVESAGMEISDVWENSGYGYVPAESPITVGVYALFLSVFGLKSITVSVESEQIGYISAYGAGWDTMAAGKKITATYDALNGVYVDLQDALNALVLYCRLGENGEYADAVVTISAEMRSGAIIDLGNGEIKWSKIINWAAFEAYGYTWEDIESASMTWETLEKLPIPNYGGANSG